MKPSAPGIVTIDQYIGTFPPQVREILERLREIIHEEAPEAEEAIHYGIPTFRLKRNLVHFTAFRHHIGFYPTPSAIEAFRKELSPYVLGRGSVRFPLDQPVPYNLVRRIVSYRVKEMENAGI
jgi:uncharacterized protein YdhG (YjbR/CyaY superfamily)